MNLQHLSTFHRKSYTNKTLWNITEVHTELNGMGDIADYYYPIGMLLEKYELDVLGPIAKWT